MLNKKIDELKSFFNQYNLKNLTSFEEVNSFSLLALNNYSTKINSKNLKKEDPTICGKKFLI